MKLKIDQITQQYGQQLALNGVSFEISSGDILGLLGPNGAGKSSLMRVISGCDEPASGKLLLDDLLVQTDSLDYRRLIGYLPEENPLYQDMYVYELLEFTAYMYGLPQATLTNTIAEVLQRCGLTAEKYKLVRHLSKGYKQRVGLAQAIIHNPHILLLDEPTSGLDPAQLIEIRALIKELGRDRIIIFSSHIMQEVEAICNRVVILKNGRMVASLQATEFGASLEQAFLENTLLP